MEGKNSPVKKVTAEMVGNKTEKLLQWNKDIWKSDCIINEFGMRHAIKVNKKVLGNQKGKKC